MDGMKAQRYEENRKTLGRRGKEVKGEDAVDI